VFEVEIAAHWYAPVIADALRCHRGTPVAFAEMAPIITQGAKPDQSD